MKNLFETLDNFQQTLCNNNFIFGLIIGAMATMMLIITAHSIKNRKGNDNE